MSNGNDRVVDNDRGYKALMKRLDKLKKGGVRVGFPEGETDSEQVLIASVHEFGAPRANIPERSYLRSTVDENHGTYVKLYASLLGQVIDGDLSPKAAFSLMGEKAKADVQEKIKNLQTPPLAEATIEAKRRKSGKDTIKMVGDIDTGNPLIDTGQMRQSVSYEVYEG